MAGAHRLPVGVIIGSAVAALLLAALFGVVVAMAFGGDEDDDQNGPLPSIAQGTPTTMEPSATAAPPSVAPSAQAEIPSSAASPSQTPTPSPTPGGGNGGDTQLVDVENIAQELPSDWEVRTQEADRIVAMAPQTRGVLILVSSTAEQALDVNDLQQAFVKSRREAHADAEVCARPEESQVPGGPAGLFFAVCYTLTPQGGQAIAVADVFLIGVQGQSVFVYNVFATREQLDAFYDQIAELPVPQWKLYSQ